MNCSCIPYCIRKWKNAAITVEKDNNIRAILFTCKPGSSPVNIPVSTPNREKSSINRKINIIDNIFFKPLL